jgi:RNA polymerase sigma-70 factor, ECF subfamily
VQAVTDRRQRPSRDGSGRTRAGDPSGRTKAGDPSGRSEAGDLSGRSEAGDLSGRDDAALMRAHITGDADAFGELVRRHRDRLWAVALRTLDDREEAADAVQDALLSAYRAAERFRGDSAVTTWLHRIVVNACLDRARRRQARPTVPLPETETAGYGAAGAGAGAGIGHGRSTGYDRGIGYDRGAGYDSGFGYDADTAMTVRAALAQLPAEQRIPLVLLDMQGYSVAEIADMLGVAEGTVKSRCARGRARLAVMLGHLRPSDAGHERPAHGNRGGVADVGPSERRSAGDGGTEVPPGGQTRAGQGGVP